MNTVFENADAAWVCYSRYEIKKDADNNEYVCPAEDASARIVTPFKDPETLIIDTLTAARELSHTDDKYTIILDYVSKYGLFGFMTALPTTASFTEYEHVYLPKNEFIKAEVMNTEDYLSLFFPFNMPDFAKNRKVVAYSVSGDREQLALMAAFSDSVIEKVMVVSKYYCERFDWIVEQFRSFLFTFYTCFLYYEDKKTADPDTLLMYRRAMSAFDANVPTYHLELRDRPTMVWDFHSLSQTIQLLLSFILTDPDTELRPCKNCYKVYNVQDYNRSFCSRKCEKEYMNTKR